MSMPVMSLLTIFGASQGKQSQAFALQAEAALAAGNYLQAHAKLKIGTEKRPYI